MLKNEQVEKHQTGAGVEPRSLACRASVLTTTLQPPVSFPCSFSRCHVGAP